MENLDLKEIRNKLDEIDTQLVGLFEKRMALCSDVAEFKIQTGKKVYDGERERQKLEAVTAMILIKKVYMSCFPKSCPSAASCSMAC